MPRTLSICSLSLALALAQTARAETIEVTLQTRDAKTARISARKFALAPWRFDVPLPPGSRILNLAVTDAGDRSPYDLANWVAAGFRLEEKKKQ